MSTYKLPVKIFDNHANSFGEKIFTITDADGHWVCDALDGFAQKLTKSINTGSKPKSPKVENKKFISDRALADRYEVSRSTIWRWHGEGNMPPTIKINGSTRWRVEDIEQWESDQEASS